MTGRVLLLCLLLAGAGARAQVRIDGMAGAGSALIDGIDAAGVNPARLADPGGPRMRLFDSFGAVCS